MFKTIIPGYYLVHSRLRATFEKASWILINPVVAGYIAANVVAVPWHAFVLPYVIAFLAWTSAYEIGYLQNDYSTVTRESAGTRRLSQREAAELDKKYWCIIGLKMAVTIALLFVLYIVSWAEHIQADLPRFGLGMLLMGSTFYVHNSIRSRWNMATLFGLYVLKYTVFAWLFPVKHWAILYIAGITVFPLPRVIEYASKTRFGLPWLKRVVGDFDQFRIKYYVILAITAAIWARVDMVKAHLCLVLLTYMLVFRLGALILVVRLKIRNGALIRQS